VNLRILVADDFAPWRHFVCSLILARKPGWQIVCEVSDGLEAVKKADELRPDLILLDVGLPKLNGIEAARQINQIAPDLKILFLSSFESPELVEQALHAEASGYVIKLDAGTELLTAVEEVLQGRRFVSGRVLEAISVHRTLGGSR
jgi:DNA-binding NarL/FixJ family response regulator